MAVGPSAAPMTAMEAASFRSKKKPRQKQGKEDAELGRRAKEHQPRLFQQRAKIDHGTDADEEQQREQLVGHARFKQCRDGAHRIPLRDGTREGQVDQNGTKAHGQQQARLHLFGDGKVDEQRTNAPHHHHLPGQIPKIGKETGECVQKIHIYFSSLCSCAGQEKRDPCHSTLSVTKVSSQHMTSGISAVMTLPCSTPQALRNALYSLLSILIKSECSPLCQGVPAFLCQTLLQRSNVVLRVVFQVWPGQGRRQRRAGSTPGYRSGHRAGSATAQCRQSALALPEPTR